MVLLIFHNSDIVHDSCTSFQTASMDWRKKLDSQKGAVLATEIKNNGFKVAKWTISAILAGSAFIKFGSVNTRVVFRRDIVFPLGYLLPPLVRIHKSAISLSYPISITHGQNKTLHF